MTQNRSLTLGNPTEAAAFYERNRTFVDTLDSLEQAFNAFFVRDVEVANEADPVVFYLGRRCVDDFLEILLLCANGHSAGASSLLRGLYERAVTAAYLHDHPEEAMSFANYDIVRRWKLAQAMLATSEAFNMSTDKLDELKAQYEEVCEKFMVTDCARCGTRRLNHTWSGFDFVSMAKKSGRLATLLVPAYYVPLSSAHSTLASISAQIGEHQGSLYRVDEPDYAEVDNVLRTAHGVILSVLATQLERFDYLDSTVLDAAKADFELSWLEQDSGSTS